MQLKKIIIISENSMFNLKLQRSVSFWNTLLLKKKIIVYSDLTQSGFGLHNVPLRLLLDFFLRFICTTDCKIILQRFFISLRDKFSKEIKIIYKYAEERLYFYLNRFFFTIFTEVSNSVEYIALVVLRLSCLPKVSKLFPNEIS